jgi:RNA polymerase sigma-B factor
MRGKASASRDELIERHLPLAKAVARRFARTPQDREELEQVAALGLVKAARRFDAGRGTAFSSYAYPTMVGEIKHYYRDAGWAVRVPNSLKERALHVEATIRRLTAERSATPSADDVADSLGLPVQDVREARAALGAYRALSLDTPSTDPGSEGETGSLGDRLGALDAGYEQVEGRIAMEPALAELPKSYRTVLRLRFDDDLSQVAIGKRVGVSQVQVSRILMRSFRTLRTADAL